MIWEKIFANYKLACYTLYKWHTETKMDSTVSLNEFNESIFFNTLIENGFLNNEERAFDFFDRVLIHCYVMPIGYNTYRSYCDNKINMIVCNEFTSRQEATERTLENAFNFLQERELGRKKLKSATQ